MREIGGYFELELPNRSENLMHSKCKLVNSGRHAFEYILKAFDKSVEKVWLPYYTCEVMLQPLKRLGIDHVFYHVNESLEIMDAPHLKEGEIIVANNYFGIKDKYIEKLSNIYGKKLIVDNAQAWYASEIYDSSSFYSPRKFFGLPDGGAAYVCKDIDMDLEVDMSYERFSHLLKRIDIGPSSGYPDFKVNSSSLSVDSLKSMSILTKKLLYSIDFEFAKSRRLGNYEYIANILNGSNVLDLPDMDSFACPLVYPYFSEDSFLRQRLIDNKIFVATYWPNVLRDCNEDSIDYKLAKNIIPIPIDQRYDKSDMDIILSIINQ